MYHDPTPREHSRSETSAPGRLGFQDEGPRAALVRCQRRHIGQVLRQGLGLESTTVQSMLAAPTIHMILVLYVFQSAGHYHSIIIIKGKLQPLTPQSPSYQKKPIIYLGTGPNLISSLYFNVKGAARQNTFSMKYFNPFLFSSGAMPLNLAGGGHQGSFRVRMTHTSQYSTRVFIIWKILCPSTMSSLQIGHSKATGVSTRIV